MAEDWVERARAALAGKEAPEVEVVPPRRPPLLDGEGVRAALAPLLAALAWAGAIFRELVTDNPFDPAALLVRAVALGLTVRAVLSGRGLARRIGVWLAAPRCGLALAPDGILFRGPDGEVAIARDDVLGVREHGHWGERSARPRWSDVYVVTRPSTGRLFERIPPVFEHTPGVLAERIMRWRGVVEAPEEHAPPPPARLPSKLYDDAARGEVPPGVTVVRHGRGWLERGPYATILLGVVVVEGFARLGYETWERLGLVLPAAIGLSLLAVPLVWIGLTWRAIAPRKGIALLLTPAEAILRTRAGVLRTTWKELVRIAVESKPAWSILKGYHSQRTLVLEPRDSPVIRYDEAFLGVPAEVVTVLGDAYRKGIIPPPGSPGASADPG